MPQIKYVENTCFVETIRGAVVGIMLKAVDRHVKVQNFEFLGKEKTLGAEIWTKLVSS